MKTLLHALVDRHTLVTHIGPAPIDPVSTQLKINAMVTDLPEWAAVALLEAEIESRRKQAMDAFQTMFSHSANTLTTQAEANYWNAQKTACDADTEAIHSKTIPLRQALEAKRAELWNIHAVYFVTPGEDLIPDDQADALQAKLDALTTEQRLTLDGTVIADLRGVRYWSNVNGQWVGATVGVLGKDIPTDSIREADLTDTQRADIAAQQEAARVAKLTADQRAAELALVLDALGSQAVAKDEKAKLMGEPLTGQAWFAEQKAGVVAKYA